MKPNVNDPGWIIELKERSARMIVGDALSTTDDVVDLLTKYDQMCVEIERLQTVVSQLEQVAATSILPDGDHVNLSTTIWLGELTAGVGELMRKEPALKPNLKSRHLCRIMRHCLNNAKGAFVCNDYGRAEAAVLMALDKLDLLEECLQ